MNHIFYCNYLATIHLIGTESHPKFICEIKFMRKISNWQPNKYSRMFPNLLWAGLILSLEEFQSSCMAWSMSQGMWILHCENGYSNLQWSFSSSTLSNWNPYPKDIEIFYVSKKRLKSWNLIRAHCTHSPLEYEKFSLWEIQIFHVSHILNF